MNMLQLVAGPADADFSFTDEPASADQRMTANGDDWLELIYDLPEYDISSTETEKPCALDDTAIVTATPPDSDWVTDSQLMELISTDCTSQHFAEALAVSIIQNSKPAAVQSADNTSADNASADKTSSLSVMHNIPVDATATDDATDDHSHCSPSPKRVKVDSPQPSPAAPCLSIEQVRSTKYQERRKKNNVSSKISRDSKKARQTEMEERVVHLERENEALRQKEKLIEKDIQIMRQQLTVLLHTGHCTSRVDQF